MAAGDRISDEGPSWLERLVGEVKYNLGLAEPEAGSLEGSVLYAERPPEDVRGVSNAPGGEESFLQVDDLPLAPFKLAAKLGTAGAAKLGAAALPAVVAAFGGKLAKTADLLALRKAEELFDAGADMQKIWKETGWFKGPDRQWRFEIHDAETGYPPPGLSKVGDTMAPETRAAYDEIIPEIPVARSTTTSTKGPGGAWYPDTKNIEIVNAPIMSEARSIFAHEQQHAIDELEGFGKGGNPKSAANAVRVEVKDPITAAEGLREFTSPAAKARRDAERVELGLAPRSPEREAELLEDIIKKTSSIWEVPVPKLKQLTGLSDEEFAAVKAEAEKAWSIFQQDPMNMVRAYKRLPGEAMARVVERRLDYTPQMRQEIYPLEDLDVPYDEIFFGENFLSKK